MNKKSFADILGHYMQGEDLERAKIMLDKTKSEFLEYESERITIQNTPQVISACIAIRTHTSRSQKYPVADLFIRNISKDSAEYTVDIEIDRCSKLRLKKKIEGNSCTVESICCNGNLLDPYLNVPVLTRIIVTDRYDRELTSVSGDITPVSELSEPKINSAVQITPEEIKRGESKVHLRSYETTSFNGLFRISNKDSGKTASIQPFSLLPEESTEKTVSLDFSALPDGTVHPVITVEVDGYQINSSESPFDTYLSENDRRSMSKLKIFAECSGLRIVDTTEEEDGSILLGAVAINTEERESQMVTVNALFDNEQVFTETVSVPVRKKVIVGITVPAKRVRRDETYQAEIRFTVSDPAGAVILDRMFSMFVRSRFDMDLTNLKEQTAAAVNPLDPVIEKFIESGNGPLAREMSSNYIVCGYQSEDEIIPQIKAAYKAVQNQNMHYVSSTETLGEGCYQRVRSPAKVLEDHSGNCIELSILYASILEAMNFEPAVVFPQGHAIVGVVMGTNAYSSGASLPATLHNRILVLGNGSEKYYVLCFEATMCANKENTFEDAVDSAYRTISEQLSSINRRSSYAMITEERQHGVKPRVD